LSAPAGVDPDIAAVAPSQLLQGLLERRQLDLAAWIVRGPVHEHTEPPHPLGLLRVRCARQRCRCRAAEQRYELTPFQSIELHALLRAKGAVPEYLIDTIMSGLAALRDFDPVFVGLGSKRESASLVLMSAFASYGPSSAGAPISRS
jgi:hypothetical protein